MLKKLKKIVSCIFVFLAYRICLSVLKLRGKLNAAVYQQQRARSIYRLHCFCRAMITVLMLIKITGESVKFIGSKYIQ